MRLPPLKAVRAFEACFRLGSYTRAAAELNVQQPAISHQIRSLETDLGLTLFVKRGAAMVPTGPAQDLYRTVAVALDDISQTCQRLRQRRRDEGVTLATYPGIASFWLLPRLAKLGASAVRVTTADLDADIPLGEVDCAILFGDGTWPGFDSRLVMPERILPVAAPKLAAELRGAPVRELLERGPLIHLEDPEERWFTWRDWRASFAPDAGALDRSLVVTNHGVAIHQALLGSGVALGWAGMIADLLDSAVLVPLSDRTLESARGYYLLIAPEFRGTEACAEVCRALGVAPG